MLNCLIFLQNNAFRFWRGNAYKRHRAHLTARRRVGYDEEKQALRLSGKKE
jgi:hypothetical protein